jgi:NAD-dependent dihydropyrimidine dehydrogenase PreA subunit
MPAERQRPGRAQVIVHGDLCKGCALCVAACPQHLLEISRQRVNRLGYFPVRFLADACSGCGVCFHACPEPGGLTICRLI